MFNNVKIIAEQFASIKYDCWRSGHFEGILF